MSLPTKIWLYRITHIRNLPHILQHGLVTEASPQANPNFVRIGDTSLIDYRKNLPAPESVGGLLSDYIPFYLAPRSPMLLQIATGWEAVEQVPQQDIVYLISSYEAISTRQLPFFFSDGHVRSETSAKYTLAKDFAQLDWYTIYATHWKSDETDLRRKEKKQAEFLVKHHVPIDCIAYIGVYTTFVKTEIVRMLDAENLEIPVRVSPKKLFYDHL